MDANVKWVNGCQNNHQHSRRFEERSVPTENESTESYADVEFDFYTVVDDELYEALIDEVGGEKIAGIALWEESMADSSDETPPAAEDRILVDLDLYLDNQVSLELYGVAAFTDPDGDPLQGLHHIGQTLADLVDGGLWLEEIAVDEDDELVLVLARNHRPMLLLSVGGWSLGEWDELPQAD
jgi:hypothetical protein